MYDRFMIRADALLMQVERLCAVISGMAALAAMLLVAADAMLRHLFSAPLTFQMVLTQDYLLVALLLLAMPWGYRSGGFIRLDFLLTALSGTARQIVLRAGLIASAIYATKLAMLSWGQFHQVWSRGDVVMGVIDWPVSWSWIWLPVGLGLLALRLAIDALSPHRLDTGSAHV